MRPKPVLVKPSCLETAHTQCPDSHAPRLRRRICNMVTVFSAVLLVGCAAPKYTIDDGRAVNPELLRSLSLFGKGERALRPAIARSAALKDPDCDRQWELPISVSSSQTWDEADRVAWVRALGVDERLTVVGSAPNLALKQGDKLIDINGDHSHDAKKMLTYLADMRDRGQPFPVRTADGQQVTLTPFEVCRGYVRLAPPNAPALQDYHWLMSIHPLEIAQADLSEDEALWTVLWTQGVSEEGGARMKTYHYSTSILSSLYTVATIASGLKGAAVAAEAAVAAAQKAAATAATEIVKQQLINQAKQYATDRVAEELAKTAKNLTQAQVAAAMQQLAANRGMLGGISRVAATVFDKADAWAYQRMAHLHASPLAGFSLHQKMLERNLLANALAFDPERLPALQALTIQDGRGDDAVALLKGIRTDALVFEPEAMPLASTAGGFSYDEPAALADTTNPYAYGLVEAMLTLPESGLPQASHAPHAK